MKKIKQQASIMIAIALIIVSQIASAYAIDGTPIASRNASNLVSPMYFSDQVEVIRPIGNGVEASILVTVWSRDGITYKIQSVDNISLKENNGYILLDSMYTISSDRQSCEIVFKLRSKSTGIDETRTRTITVNGEIL